MQNQFKVQKKIFGGKFRKGTNIRPSYNANNIKTKTKTKATSYLEYLLNYQKNPYSENNIAGIMYG